MTLHDNGMLGVFVRNYGRTDLANQEQIRDLVLMNDNTPYDSLFIEEQYIKDDYSKLFSVAAQRNVRISEKELISKMVISPDKKLARGTLLFRDDCDDVRTKVVVTQWPGVTKGVVNAIGYRNYYIQGSQIEANIYKDRLEITSPGWQ